MTEQERVIRICKELAINPYHYVVMGSGSMIMHGITEIDRGKPMGDLDIFCATEVWFNFYHSGLVGIIEEGSESPWQLFTPNADDTTERCDPPYLYRTMYGLPVHVFFSWRHRARGNLDIAWHIYNSKLIAGIPVSDLQYVLDWKQETGRAKDLQDITAIRNYLGETS